MKRWMILAVLSLASLAADDGSVSEAKARLDAKQQAAKEDAAKPAAITRGELEQLRREITQLRTENALLRKQLAERPSTATAPRPGAKPAAAKRTDVQIRADIQDFREHLVGMKLDEAVARLKELGATGNPPFMKSASGTTKYYDVDTNSSWDFQAFHLTVDKDGTITAFN